MQAFAQEAHRHQSKLGVGFAGVLTNISCAEVEFSSQLKRQAAILDVGGVFGWVKFNLHGLIVLTILQIINVIDAPVTTIGHPSWLH